ncbi:unnamed protein product [Coregonus sp. 'balchen']|nr:unnamed protein product [Coregonus sp. 'balchen']
MFNVSDPREEPIYDTVEVDGKEMRMEVDTGASPSVINPAPLGHASPVSSGTPGVLRTSQRSHKAPDRLTIVETRRLMVGQDLVKDQRLCQSKSHQDSVLSALNQQRKDGLLCDVTLVAGDQKFHAHKAAMFSLCMVESEADEVALQGVTSVGLKHALDFAYTGQELNSVNYLDLYRVADLFHLPALEEAVVSFLVEHLCELQQSRQEEVLLLPYRLLRELVVCWLEHDCRYQYTEDLIQHVRYGLMDVAALHHVAQCHPLVQSSATAATLVDEAIEYHRATYAQPLHQTAHTKPRFQSLTLYIAGGRKREVSRVRELRYFNPAAQENVRVAGCSNWSELAPMPAGRSHHCVAVMGHFLFVAGGEVEHSTGRMCAVRTACRYDPRGNRWTEIASMKACREHFVLGALGQYLYANQWLARSPMLQRRVYHVMAVVRRQLYVLGGQNESGVAVHDDRIYVVGGYSIWTNEPLACIQVLDVSTEGKEEVFYGPTLPFASNGIATCFLPAPYFTCPNLQTLQVPHHRIGAV